MSELLRIGLVAEGPTDYEVINAALQAVLPLPFHMTLLQPEPTSQSFGGGWGGVLKWCHAASQRHTGPMGQDPTLFLYDLLILHVDADVAKKAYEDCGPAVQALAQSKNWGLLPCHQPCPPASNTCLSLEEVMLSWLNPVTADTKTILCIPAQSTGTWLASAVLDPAHPLLQDPECNVSLEDRLSQLPKKQRIRKTQLEYRRHAPSVTKKWEKVKQACSQAAMFDQHVSAQLISAGH